MAWDCVDVLSNACKNFSARQALIKTYQFLPPLARLLSDHLSSSKKKKLLTLMQVGKSLIFLVYNKHLLLIRMYQVALHYPGKFHI